MKGRSRRIIAIISLAVGTVMLTSAAIANYSTMCGYAVSKNALKGLLKNENYTAEISYVVTVDGELSRKQTFKQLYSFGSDVPSNIFSEIEDKLGYYNSGTSSYHQDNKQIVIYHNKYKEDQSFIHDNVNLTNIRGTFNRMVGSEEDMRAMNKTIRFAELMCDTVIGDIKNNFVYIAGDDNSATYEVNLDAIQIPEYVNVGLSVLFSTVDENDYIADENPFIILGDDPIAKDASLILTVDNEGRLTDGKAVAVMDGNGHELEAEIGLKMYDYGKTVPQRVDISTLKNVEITDMSAKPMSYGN